jgi:Flp pilus assembly protein TadD
VAGPDATALPKKLQGNVDRAKDAASLTALATAYLQRGNPQAARLTFLRALEADKANAPALAGLGWALLQVGEATEAGRAYSSALASDPTYALARGNLAALRCRFGDVEGAQADLAKVGDKGLLTGPAADPEWQRCSSTAVSLR